MPRIRVLVVDDTVVMRRLIANVLEGDSELELAGVAANGRLALAKIPQVNPDIVTLDVEMPELNGIETIKEIRKLYPKLPVIMFSTMTTAARPLPWTRWPTAPRITSPSPPMSAVFPRESSGCSRS